MCIRDSYSTLSLQDSETIRLSDYQTERQQHSDIQTLHHLIISTINHSKHSTLKQSINAHQCSSSEYPDTHSPRNTKQPYLLRSSPSGSLNLLADYQLLTEEACADWDWLRLTETDWMKVLSYHNQTLSFLIDLISKDIKEDSHRHSWPISFSFISEYPDNQVTSKHQQQPVGRGNIQNPIFCSPKPQEYEAYTQHDYSRPCLLYTSPSPRD